MKDGFLDMQTVQTFRDVRNAKVNSARHLDTLTRQMCKETLDYFVAFSSIVSGRGNIGQTNYGYANSVLERICEKRMADGLPGRR